MSIANELLAITLNATLDDRALVPVLARGVRRFATAPTDVDAFIDALVAQIDHDAGLVLDAILHHPRVRALERIWRATWYLVQQADGAAGVRLDVLNCSRDDLQGDFEDAPELAKSGLYKITYSGHYGPFGGRPYAAAVFDHEFAATPADVDLLDKCANVMSLAAGVLLAGADVSLLGRRDVEELATRGPAEPTAAPAKVAARWDALRASDAAFTTGLVAQRLLARAPYEAGASTSLGYAETIRAPSDLVWFGGAFAVAALLVKSFARHGTAARITGVEEGAVGDAARWRGPRGDWPVACGLDGPFDDAVAGAVAAAGFIPLVVGRDDGAVHCAVAPNACSAVPVVAKDLAEPDRALHRRLETALYVTRFTMYLKVIQRESIGPWKKMLDLEENLRSWLVALPGPRGPTFRSVDLRLRLEPTTPGWYDCVMLFVPGHPIEGRSATLAIATRFDRE